MSRAYNLFGLRSATLGHNLKSRGHTLYDPKMTIDKEAEALELPYAPSFVKMSNIFILYPEASDKIIGQLTPQYPKNHEYIQPPDDVCSLRISLLCSE